jgi:hypothetical protein
MAPIAKPTAPAIASAKSIPGSLRPFSMFMIVCRLTPTRCASASCESPASIRYCFKFDWYGDIREVWSLEPTDVKFIWHNILYVGRELRRPTASPLRPNRRR